MRIIENILLKDNLLEESKRAENIEALCKQIKYYLSNNAELAERFLSNFMRLQHKSVQNNFVLSLKYFCDQNL